MDNVDLRLPVILVTILGYYTYNQDYINNKIMTRNIFPNPHVGADLLSKRRPPKANQRRERYVESESLNRTLCWGGVLNMRDLVG